MIKQGLIFPKHKEIPSKCVFKRQSKIYGEKKKRKIERETEKKGEINKVTTIVGAFSL